VKNCLPELALKLIHEIISQCLLTTQELYDRPISATDQQFTCSAKAIVFRHVLRHQKDMVEKPL